MEQLQDWMHAFKVTLDTVSPAAFPVALVTLLWSLQWAIRRWAPWVWEWAANFPFRAGLLELDRHVRKVWQAIPSAIGGAVLLWLAGGGEFFDLVLGAAFGVLAPVWHELLKKLPGPYGRPKP